MLSSLISRLRIGAAVAVVATSLTATSAHTSPVVGEWSMRGVGDGTSAGAGEAPPLRFAGNWRQVTGFIGGAVKFTSAPSSGVARGTADMNPGTRDFAMSLVFTSGAIPQGVGYSGNLMQKGRSYSGAQIKLQLVPAQHGTVKCTIEGFKQRVRLTSTVRRVDDGRWHTASCWRNGDLVGLTVDATTERRTITLGAITNSQPVRVGNKSRTAGAADQHFGANDCSVFVIGSHARAAAARRTPC